MLGDEGLELGGVAADQGGRAALREQQRGQLLVEVAQALRVVDDQRAGALGDARIWVSWMYWSSTGGSLRISTTWPGPKASRDAVSPG